MSNLLHMIKISKMTCFVLKHVSLHFSLWNIMEFDEI